MPSPKTKILSQQSRDILDAFEFRVNVTYETRPTLEYRRYNDYHWHELALIQPGSNYFVLLAQTLIDATNQCTDVVEAQGE